MKRLRATPWTLAVGMALACAPSPPPNIVLIVIDTLRADRLGAYGSTRGLTPFLDRLAERSFVFHSAHSTSPWTNPSVASILTSRHPSTHGVSDFRSALADGEITLAEELSRHGWATGGFVANYLLRSKLGFDQGYETYVARPASAGAYVPLRAPAVNRLALEWLDSLDTDPRPPIFLHLHYMEPHTPYDPPEAILRRLSGDRPRPDLRAISEAALRAQKSQWSAEQLAELERVYDAEVAALDAALGDLFAALERRGLLSHALVAVTADHGQELWDHGSIGHGHTLYSELIRVPLLLQRPGQSRRVDVAAVASLVDLAPTLLAAVGVPAPGTFRGRSLLPILDARPLAPSPGPGELAFAELAQANGRVDHERAVVSASGKLIRGRDEEREFYAADDPTERDPDGLAEPERIALERALDAFARRADSPGAPRTRHELTPAELDGLRALGYLDAAEP